MSNLAFSGYHEKPSIQLLGVEEGGTYASPINLKFIVKNMEVAEAGINKKNSGHHHLLIDLNELPNMKAPLPMTENIIHYGKGQTSAELKLSPGKHTIQLLFADYSHTPQNPPLITNKIYFFIK